MSTWHHLFLTENISYIIQFAGYESAIGKVLLLFLNLKQCSYCVTLLFFSLCYVQLFVIPWTEAHPFSLSFSISWSLLNLISIESVMLSNYLIFCFLLVILPSIFPSIRDFSNESDVHNRRLKYCNFSFSHFNEYFL